MSNLITKIVINTMQICGNGTGTCVLLSVGDLQEYVEGKATGNVIGQKYSVVCPDMLYEKFTVKVKNSKPTITNEQIQQKGGQIKVNFKNLSGKFYRTSSGEYAVSCSADSVEVTA